MTASGLVWRIRADRQPRGRGRLLRYLLVGCLSFGVDFGVLAALRQAADTPLWVATTAAYWTGFCVNFTLQRRVTFTVQGPVGGHLLRYAALVVVNYVGTVVLVDGANAAGIGYATGKIVAVSLFVAVNYLAYGRWVFRDQELPDGR